jgi:hypothetical protein
VTFSSPVKGGTASGGGIVVYSNNEAYGYHFNPTNNSGGWTNTVTFSSPIKGSISTAK